MNTEEIERISEELYSTLIRVKLLIQLTIEGEKIDTLDKLPKKGKEALANGLTNAKEEIQEKIPLLLQEIEEVTKELKK